MNALPIGAILTNFSHPSFDEQNRPVSLATASEMVIKSAEKLTAAGLKLRLLRPDRSIDALATVSEASFLVNQERIVATGEVFVKGDTRQFAARAPSGTFELRTRQALLDGPAQTSFEVEDKTDSSISSLPRRSPSLLRAALLRLIAAPPLPIPPADVAAFEERLKPRPLPALSVGEDARKNFDKLTQAPRPLPTDAPQTLTEADTRVAALSRRLTGFLARIGQTHLLAQSKLPAAPAPTADEIRNLFLPSKTRLVIDAEKGIYFDGNSQEFAYLGKVRLLTGGLNMSCTDGLRAIMLPPPEHPPKEQGEEDRIRTFGDLKQVTATGSIIVKGVNEQGEPIEARADRALYDAQKQELILRGKDMFFRQGGVVARSQDPQAIVRLTLLPNKRLQGAMDGRWRMGLPVE